MPLRRLVSSSPESLYAFWSRRQLDATWVVNTAGHRWLELTRLRSLYATSYNEARADWRTTSGSREAPLHPGGFLTVPFLTAQESSYRDPITSTSRNTTSVRHDEHVVTAKPWLYLGDLRHVDDCAAMHPDELARVQTLLHVTERLSYVIHALHRMKTQVVIVCFNAHHVVRVDESRSALFV